MRRPLASRDAPCSGNKFVLLLFDPCECQECPDEDQARRGTEHDKIQASA
ncbi:hypothetical protein HanPI659440_Chr06g0226721 [Helianthus annuus]|nr:hypothetical protein HanPI659440_Chr06g0226721 [Helianthus annuus]